MRKHRTNERGVILMTSLLFAMTILAFSASVITSGVAASNQKRYLIAKQRALGAAESGVYHLLAGLNGTQRASLMSAGKLEATLEGNVESKRAIRYAVTFGSGAADGIDNDLDGTKDESDEADIVEVSSTGYADNLARTVRVTLIARHRQPSMPGAVYIADPTADFTFNGNSFFISGKDIDLTGTETGVLVPGVGVAGDTSGIEAEVADNQKDNIVGLGGIGSIHEVSSIDLRPLIDDGIRSANVIMEADADGYTAPENPGDWGTLTTPTIVFGSGDFHIEGGAEGAGLLIVDGNLKISGNFLWQGLLIVRGSIEFTGGGDTKRVVGGVVVENNLGGGAGDLITSGTIDLIYSEATLARASQVFAAFSIMNWREGPNPVEVSP